jgi:hypothetical protein
MSRLNRIFLLAFLLFFAMAAVNIFLVPPRVRAEDNQDSEAPLLVGRISHVEGQLLRYVPEEKDWVATVKDAPFGINDTLYSDEAGKAEFILPNNTWIRIDGDTQIQSIAIENDLTEMDVASGIARFYNKGSDVELKVTTPFGYVSAPGNTCFDLYVGDNSVEVVSLTGTVYFIHNKDDARYEVIEGSSSLLADNEQITAGERPAAGEWDAWNRSRDALWAKRLEVKGDSVKYLPPQLRDDAYELERHGKWERVYYDGAYRPMWRPYVRADWEPFTVGRWTVWYGDNTWIPYEPFGYVTHHYGNWVHVGPRWYWAPPVVRARVHVAAPLLHIGFGWYPGRVGWIYSGTRIGWVPLAYNEIYYGHRPWGRRTVVINEYNINRIHIYPNKYRYYNRAIIVDRHNFYRVNDYRRVRIRNINKTTIIRNYRGAPVVNRTVFRDYDRAKERYRFNNVVVNRKPHLSTFERIQRNQLVAEKRGRIRGAEVRREIQNKRRGTVVEGARVASPKVKRRIVPVRQVNQPESQVKFKERDLRKIQQQNRRTGEADRLKSEPVRKKGGQPSIQERRERRKSLTPEQIQKREEMKQRREEKRVRQERSRQGQIRQNQDRSSIQERRERRKSLTPEQIQKREEMKQRREEKRVRQERSRQGQIRQNQDRSSIQERRERRKSLTPEQIQKREEMKQRREEKSKLRKLQEQERRQQQGPY